MSRFIAKVTQYCYCNSMVQFIFTYWWVLLLLVVIVAILTNTIVKFLMFLLIAVAGAIVYWNIFITPGFKKVEACFTSGTQITDSIYDQAKSMAPGDDRDRFVCSSDTESFARLTECFMNVQKRDKFSFFLITHVPVFRKQLDGVIANHNRSCPDAQLQKPSFLE